MLRGRPDDPQNPTPATGERSPAGEPTDFPGLEQPYVLGERPPHGHEFAREDRVERIHALWPIERAGRDAAVRPQFQCPHGMPSRCNPHRFGPYRS